MEWDATFKEFVYGYVRVEEWLEAKGFDKDSYKILNAELVDFNNYSEALIKVEGYADLMTLDETFQYLGRFLPICWATDDGPELIGIAVNY